MLRELASGAPQVDPQTLAAPRSLDQFVAHMLESALCMRKRHEVAVQTKIVALSALLAVAGCRQPAPSNVLRVSGHAEATEVQVAPEIGGRVIDLRINEGDRVHRGDLLAKLDTADTALQIERVRAERAVAAAQLRLLQAGARPEEIRQAQAQAEAAATETAAAEAELRAAETTLRRLDMLLEASAVSRQQRDDAKATVDVAMERRRGAQERTRAASELVARLRAGARREELEGARARIASIDAQLALLDKSVRDAAVTAPIDGVITLKLVEVGELVAPRMPLLVIADLDHAWADLFVPEPMLPRVKLGQDASLFTDAGGREMPGKVTFISPKAEFTPRNVQTADERSKLVYRIKVTVDNSAGVLKQGMPVDAELVLQ